MIAAIVLSESELAKVIPDWTMDIVNNNPNEFRKILWDLGGDIHKPWEIQENIIHRNRIKEVVQCNRWILSERLDRDWINSGFASREAKNLASGSRMVQDLDTHKYDKL